MDFSIIIPVLNEEDNLPACLDSLKGLDYPKDKYEVIIVDNGSTDKSVEIVKGYGFEVLHEEKKGITYARQKGLEAAKGTYYITTDADARVPENWLKVAKTIFDSDPKIVGVTGPAFAYDSNVFVNDAIGYAGYYLTRIPRDKFLMGCNMAMKTKEALECGGFLLKNYKFYEDAIITNKISKLGKIKVDNKFRCYISSRRYRGLKAVNIFRNILNHASIKYANTVIVDQLPRFKKS